MGATMADGESAAREREHSLEAQTQDRARRMDRVEELAHRRPLIELGEKVSPRHAALLVIDLQNDFCAEGGMMHSEGLDLTMVQTMAKSVGPLVQSARDSGVLCVFVKNVYSTPTNWYLSDSWLEQAFRRRGKSYIERDVCALDSWSGDFYGDVRPNDDEPVVTKHRYDPFSGSDLDLILRAHDVRTVVLSGVATNVCVETTARAAFVRDYYVVIPSDAVATYSEEEQRNSLRTLDRYFAEVVTVDEVTAIWAADSKGHRTGAV